MKHFFKIIRNLTQPLDGSIEKKMRHTRTLSTWEGSLWAIMWGVGESYIAPFALFLGASNLVMAFIGTGPVLITAAAQLIGALLLDRMSRRMPIILTGMTIQAATFLPLFLLPVLLTEGKITALIICIASYFFFFGLAVPAWMSLMGDVVEPSERGRYFSNRSRITMYFMITALLTAGVVTTGWEETGHTAIGFGFIFGLAALARFSSLFFMRRHYDAPVHRQQHEERFSFWDFLCGIRKSNFTRFTLAVTLVNGATNIAGPFFAVYMLRDLQWSYLAFTVSTLTFLISQTLFVRWWGSIGDRHGNRSVLVATSCLIPILPLLWLFSTNYIPLLFAQIISGAAWSGFNLAASNFIYDSVPQARRARALSYYSLMNGTLSVVGGMVIGAFIAEHAPSEIHFGLVHITMTSSLPVVFVVSAMARAIAAAIMLPQFKEVRDIEPIATARILWRLGIGQPLFGQVGEFMPRLRTFTRPPKKRS